MKLGVHPAVVATRQIKEGDEGWNLSPNLDRCLGLLGLVYNARPPVDIETYDGKVIELPADAPTFLRNPFGDLELAERERIRRCRCGTFFAFEHGNEKYCSPRCRKAFGDSPTAVKNRVLTHRKIKRIKTEKGASIWFLTDLLDGAPIKGSPEKFFRGGVETYKKLQKRRMGGVTIEELRRELSMDERAPINFGGTLTYCYYKLLYPKFKGDPHPRLSVKDVRERYLFGNETIEEIFYSLDLDVQARFRY